MGRIAACLGGLTFAVFVGACATTSTAPPEPEPPAGEVLVSLQDAREARLAKQLAAIDPGIEDFSGRASVIAWSCWHTPGTVEADCGAISSLPRASSVADVDVHDEILECHRACTIYRTQLAADRAADLANPQPHADEEECVFHCYDKLAYTCSRGPSGCARGCLKSARGETARPLRTSPAALASESP